MSNVLLRFRLARPVSPKVGKSAKWHQDARPIDEEEVRTLWGRVRRCFVQNQEYGSYDAAVLLAGEHTAKHLLAQGSVKTRGQVEPSTTNESASGSGKGKGKRGRDNDDDDDDSDLMIVHYVPEGQAGPSSVRRRTRR